MRCQRHARSHLCVCCTQDFTKLVTTAVKSSPDVAVIKLGLLKTLVSAAQTPSVYYPSARVYPGKIPPVEYDSNTIVRQVRHNGEIKWHSDLIYVSQVLAHEPLGFKQIEEQKWEVRYSFHLLGILDERLKTIVPVKSWHHANAKKV